MRKRGCFKVLVIVSSMTFIITSLFYLALWPALKIKIIKKSLFSINIAIDNYNIDYPNYKITTNTAENTSKLLGKNGRNKRYLNSRSVVIKKGILIDYWDRPLIFQTVNSSTNVFSSGKTKIVGDSDDIRSEHNK